MARGPLLSGLPDDDLEVLARYCDQVVYPSGAMIVRQGDETRELYVLLEGDAALSRNAMELGVIGPGTHFGEISLVGGGRRSATVQARSEVAAARLGVEGYRALVAAHPAVAHRLTEWFVDQLGAQLVSMTDSVELLYDRPGLPRQGRVKVTLVTHDVAEARYVEAGTRLSDIVPAKLDDAPVVAAQLGRRPVALATPVLAEVRVEPISLSTWEGREVWRRSAGLLFLAAARRIAPRHAFTLAHSVAAGRVVRGTADDDVIAAIEREMARLARDRVPFVRERGPSSRRGSTSRRAAGSTPSPRCRRRERLPPWSWASTAPTRSRWARCSPTRARSWASSSPGTRTASCSTTAPSWWATSRAAARRTSASARSLASALRWRGTTRGGSRPWA